MKRKKNNLTFCEFFSNTIRHNFVPVDFRASDRQHSSKSFERRLRHRVIVVPDATLNANKYLTIPLRYCLYDRKVKFRRIDFQQCGKKCDCFRVSLRVKI